jgi:uncharacterized membrane protein YccC
VLTIVVIMRQGYGLTKQRTFHRIFGTILGAFIAFGPFFLTHWWISNHRTTFGFSFTPTTKLVPHSSIYVIFIYGILAPDIEI